jgi:hypothetical protein
VPLGTGILDHVSFKDIIQCSVLQRTPQEGRGTPPGGWGEVAEAGLWKFTKSLLGSGRKVVGRVELLV